MSWSLLTANPFHDPAEGRSLEALDNGNVHVACIVVEFAAGKQRRGRDHKKDFLHIRY